MVAQHRKNGQVFYCNHHCSYHCYCHEVSENNVLSGHHRETTFHSSFDKKANFVVVQSYNTATKRKMLAANAASIMPMKITMITMKMITMKMTMKMMTKTSKMMIKMKMTMNVTMKMTMTRKMTMNVMMNVTMKMNMVQRKKARSPTDQEP
jgi:hypothetical protein